MNKGTEKKVLLVNRLTEEVYRNFVKKYPPPIVSNDTSPHMAGYLLGIQKVLQDLREGVVINAD